MDDRDLDGWLGRVGAAGSGVDAGPDFRERIWQRVGELTVIRQQRRRLLLGLVVFAVGLGAGMVDPPESGPTPTGAHALADGWALAPSTLLGTMP
ncbi:MAG: hypothetical protein R3F35_10790 [Myxococcota bacterium]